MKTSRTSRASEAGTINASRFTLDDLNARWHFTKEGWVLEYDHPDGAWENRRVLFSWNKFDAEARGTGTRDHERFEYLALRAFEWEAKLHPAGASSKPYNKLICRGK